MKFAKIIYLLFVFFLSTVASAQEVITTPERTPEQEATRQTEKLQQELDLTPDQTRKVYEINLKYARERQISNSRAEALERIKNKDTELKRVLTDEQYATLQDKRYEQNRNRTNTTPNVPVEDNNTTYRMQTTYRQRQIAIPGQTPPASFSTFRASGNEQRNQRQQQQPPTNNNGNNPPQNYQRTVPGGNQGNGNSTYRAVRPPSNGSNNNNSGRNNTRNNPSSNPSSRSSTSNGSSTRDGRR